MVFHYRATPRFSASLGVWKWLARDPLPDAENIQGANLYEYVQNNSLRRIDNLGLEGEPGSMSYCAEKCGEYCKYAPQPDICFIKCFDSCTAAKPDPTCITSTRGKPPSFSITKIIFGFGKIIFGG